MAVETYAALNEMFRPVALNVGHMTSQGATPSFKRATGE